MDKLGKASVDGERHLHFYKNAEPPTGTGESAVTAEGTYMVSTETSITWKNVEPGSHTFYVHIVNNVHTLLDLPVTAKINVEETGNGGEPFTIDFTGNNLPFRLTGFQQGEDNSHRHSSMELGLQMASAITAPINVSKALHDCFPT